MHLIRSENYGGGEFVCPLTGRIYAWRGGKSERARALKRLEDEQQEVIEKREKLAGRKLTMRELRLGIEHVDSRSVAEKIADQPKTKPQKQEANFWRARLRELQVDLRNSCNEEEKEKIQRRIVSMEVKANEMDAQLAAEVAEKKAAKELAVAKENERYVNAIEHAYLYLENMKYSKEVEQRELEFAERRIADLEATADYETYWKDAEPFLKAYEERVCAEADKRRAAAKTLNQEADEIVKQSLVKQEE